ncbi:MAG: acyltransferase domain-containing protein [Lachnospiraceae bacterium]|nr:acyltransferase domain-containing protein [Lachnospiraceae bacterium]
MSKKPDYNSLIEYLGMKKLPKGLCEAYELYEPEGGSELLPHDKYEDLLKPYDLPSDKKSFLDETLAAVEADDKILFFSRFFVWDMCSMRNKYDIDNYTELVPHCLGKYNEAYAFLVLLACVPVSEKEMIRRGIPKEYYEDIPHRMLRDQLKRYKETGSIDVEDMPWKMNFYTLTIFLLDRFLFIPYKHGERFRMYRNIDTGKVIGLCEDGCIYDSEGQNLRWGFDDEDEWRNEECNEPAENHDGKKNGFFYSMRKAAAPGTFKTYLKEDENSVTGFYMNPLGYTENRTVTLDKSEYRLELKEGDWLIALHIPGGEGYTPERMMHSMALALDFFKKYYPELDMKGFWSSSWLYDERLRFLIGDGRNITNVQNLMFRYSDGEDGSMLYVHLYKDLKNSLEDYPCETSLQQKAKEYLLKGKRFTTTGMMILKEEALSGRPYYTEEDIADWEKLVKTLELRV